jgi:hypothetical protein
MDSLAETAPLAAHTGRAAGTDAERRAANDLRDDLEALNLAVEVTPLWVRPRTGLTHALHCVLGIVGSVVSVSSAAAGGAIVLVAALSTALDVVGFPHLTRRLTPSRASQNVDARGPGSKPGTLLLTAAVDSPRPSNAFTLARRVFRDPWLALLLALLALLVCAVLRLLGVDAVTGPQFVATVVLIVLTPAFADTELSVPGPDRPGAAAAEVVLDLAQELGDRLESFEPRVLFTGAAHSSALGMRRWLRQNRADLEPARTAVISIGPVGDGPVRFTTREGAIVALRTHRQLARICREIAEDDGQDGAYDARPAIQRLPTPTAAALTRGLPAISVSTDGPDPGPDDVDRLRGFCRELAERLDAEVGPTLAEG